MIILFLIGFVYVPIFSYVATRLEGISGEVVQIAFVQQVLFILSGYNGVGIWFLPVPQPHIGKMTLFYKQAELLGTKFNSLWKANYLLFPIIIISMLVFSNFIWSIAEVPSQLYPYAQEIWDFEAKNACLMYSSTIGEYSQFYEALDLGRILIGFGAGLFIYFGLGLLSAPVTLIYGLVRGINQTLPHVVIPQVLGALLGRLYFQRKFGVEKWRNYIPVFSAGYACGAGLMASLCIGLVFLIKASSSLPF
jgi:hypothetical protein